MPTSSLSTATRCTLKFLGIGLATIVMVGGLHADSIEEVWDYNVPQ
jgi:hypothetical protein